MSQAENHQWLQNIHYLLNIHGFSDIWNNSLIADDTFNKAFKLWVDDQFDQITIGKLQPSSRFITLKENSYNRGHDSYTVRSTKYEQFSSNFSQTFHTQVF